MNRLARFRTFMLPFAFLLMFLGVLAAPTPVYADNMDGDVPWITQIINNVKQQLEEISWIKDIFGVISDINDLLNKFLNKINDSWNNVGKVLSAGQQAQVETKTRLAQAEITTQTENKMTKTDANLAANGAKASKSTAPAGGSLLGGGPNGTIPPVDNQILCNTIIARQLEMIMTSFADMVSGMVAEGIDLQDRGPGGDGTGPSHVANEKKTVCGQMGDGGPATRHSIDNDDPSCTGQQMGGGAPSLQDAHITPPDRSTPLRVPPMQQYTVNGVTALVPVPDDDIAEMRFLAARNYCAEVAGPRVSPPYANKMSTPEGMAVMAQFDHCESLRSVFVKQCTDRIGMLSRPDCSNPDFSDICKTAVAACSAAQASGVELPPSFNNCNDGLSLYEAEYISHAICLSGDRAAGVTGAGDRYSTATKQNDICAQMTAAWKKQLALEDANFNRAMADLNKLPNCWAKATGSFMTLIKSSDASDKMDVGEKAQKTRLQTVPDRTEKAAVVQAKAQKDLSDGDAVYADELLIKASAP